MLCISASLRLKHLSLSTLCLLRVLCGFLNGHKWQLKTHPLRLRVSAVKDIFSEHAVSSPGTLWFP